MYHLTGLISTSLYCFSVYGIWVQLRKIWSRKEDPRLKDEATSVISLNFIVMAFLAFYVLFLYGLSLEYFDHYLVWPRMAAMLLTLRIMYEIKVDRRQFVSNFAFWTSSALICIGILFLLLFRERAIALVSYSQALIVVVAILLAQGNVAQIMTIVRSRSTGGVSLRSHQLTFIKDMGFVFFGIAMGLSNGWPVMILCGSNAIFKLIIMYLFRWVKK